MTDERTLRAALTSVLEPGAAALHGSVRSRGVEATWAAALDGGFGAGVQRRAQQTDPHRVLVGRTDWRFVIPGDDEWPDGLDVLELIEPVQGMLGQPLGLWLRGPGNLRRLTARSVAVVGSRASSTYGQTVASDLGLELARHAATVVSGGAYGIDAAAHRGALAAPGPTLCVLAGGVDVPYPQGNAGLIERIAAEHLVVSEYVPGSHPVKRRFLARNRLIAALTQGTVLVEAAARSGARNTVTWAAALNRVVMAVPGPVTSSLSVGPHRLIREGRASLVAGAPEVLELVCGVGQATLFEAEGEARLIDQLDGAEAAVFEALPSRGWMPGDVLATRARLTWPAASAALARLERRGLVRRGPTGFALAQRRGNERVRAPRDVRVVLRDEADPPGRPVHDRSARSLAPGSTTTG